eukprot:5310187-Amphidinium_carterae.1
MGSCLRIGREIFEGWTNLASEDVYVGGKRAIVPAQKFEDTLSWQRGLLNIFKSVSNTAMCLHPPDFPPLPCSTWSTPAC